MANMAIDSNRRGVDNRDFTAQREAVCQSDHGAAVLGATLLILSDIRFVREGLAELLAQDHAFAVAGVAASVGDVFDILARKAEPEIILIDASLPCGRSVAQLLRKRVPLVRLVAFAVAETEDEVIAWAEAGVAAYLPRTTALKDIIKRLNEICRGEQTCAGNVAAGLLRRIASAPHSADGFDVQPCNSLTSREHEVVQLIVAGMSNKEIARHLNIGVATVKSHVHNLLTKLALSRRSQLAFCVRDGNTSARWSGGSPSRAPSISPSLPASTR